MWIDRLPARSRRLIIVCSDVAGICLALYLAFFLRFEGKIPSGDYLLLAKLYLVQLPLRMAMFIRYGLYRGVWRYASIEDLMAIFRAVSLSSMLSVIAVWLVFGFTGFPRSVFVIDWMLCILFIGGARFSARTLRTHASRHKNGRRTIIVGADDAGESLLRSLLFRPEEYHVVGLVSDNPNKQNKHIHGVPVVGTRACLAEIVEQEQIQEILIAMPFASADLFRDIVTQCQAFHVRIRRIPPVKDLLNGEVTFGQLREVQLEDLLGREPVSLNNDNVALFLHGKVVLVTGAGGSIGSELCRQVARVEPELLLMLDQAENGLYYLENDLRHNGISISRKMIIGDVTDSARMHEVFSTYRPQIVFHAAAHKHVPLMEDNKKEAIKNNVIGTMTLARAAEKHNVEKLVMISTDKAVNPTSMMGASKRLAEMILQRMARTSQTAFVTVRFGNVLGSEGSVVPLFKKQIKDGGPVTVTDPEMKRYFMTIPEAVQLVLQAGAMGEGGEIYVLDMGEPVKIVDLAKNLITLSGFRPEEIGIEFVGLRPGEKLYEELWISDEKVKPTQHSKILVAEGTAPLQDLNGKLQSFLTAAVTGSDRDIVKHLQELVPNYEPSCQAASVLDARLSLRPSFGDGLLAPEPQT